MNLLNFKNGIVMLLTFNSIYLSDSTFGFDYAVVAGFGALTATLYQSFNRFIGCRYECCSTETGQGDWIPINIRELSQSLKSKVHGQHLVSNIVVRALKAHYDSHQPSKALVLSFHGWTGGGKNFVAQLIAKSIFKKGMTSKFVHLLVSTVAFPHEDEVDIYKLQVQDWIRGNVSECKDSVFIFDEIDKMPVGMIDAIKPFIDYHERLFGIDFRRAVFIFLSNSGSQQIIKKTLQNWREGKKRTDITHTDMEGLIEKGAFNEEGGLHESHLIQRSLIDFYVPFLPLERAHIELCIKDELQKRNMRPTSEFIKKVMDSMMFFPPENQLYSTKGCKSVATKVGYMITDEQFEDVFS